MKTHQFKGNNSNEVMAELVALAGGPVQIINLDWATREALYTVAVDMASVAKIKTKREKKPKA